MIAIEHLFYLVNQINYRLLSFRGLEDSDCKEVAYISPTLTALTSLHSSEQEQGFTLGVFRSSGSIARACGPMLAGLSYFLFGSSFTYTTGALLLLIPFIILLRVPKPQKEDPSI